MDIRTNLVKMKANENDYEHRKNKVICIDIFLLMNNINNE